MSKENEVVQYDTRLASMLKFVCKILDIKKEDFVSLALVNLLEEELDWIKYNDEIQVDSEEVEKHQISLTKVKMETSSRVLK